MNKRWRLGLCICSLLLSSVGQAANKPQRIVSLSLCTDQVLLQLVNKSRIAAITHLSFDPVYSYYWQKTDDIKRHYGLAEQIIPLKPDLIIGAQYSNDNAVQMMRHLGHEVITIHSPETLTEVASFTRAIGAAVGEPEKAEQLIDSMQQEIASAKAMVTNLPEQWAISYGPNGFTAGTKTLKNEILAAAGYKNIASKLGIEHFGHVSLEQLVWSNPDAVIIDQDSTGQTHSTQNSSGQSSLAQSFTRHPIIKRLFKHRNMPTVPTHYWICPGPLASKAILALAEQRQ